MRIVYGDLAFALNGGMDYLALCCTASLIGLPKRQLRLVIAAALGGLYGVLGQLFLWQLPVGILLCAGGMVYLSFGWDKWFLRRFVLFLTVSAALGGMCAMAQTLWLRLASPWVIFGAAALAGYAALSVIFHGGARGRGDLVRAELCHGGRTIRVTLLRDTGNTLREAASGEIFCILSGKAAQPLLAGQEVLLRSINFTSLGEENGELAWFYCDRVAVDGVTYYRYPVALEERGLFEGRGFGGLWKGEGGSNARANENAVT